MADNTHTLILDVTGIPEVLFGMFKQMADMLREEADSEADPRLQRKLRELAARFEAGQSHVQ